MAEEGVDAVTLAMAADSGLRFGLGRFQLRMNSPSQSPVTSTASAWSRASCLGGRGPTCLRKHQALNGTLGRLRLETRWRERRLIILEWEYEQKMIEDHVISTSEYRPPQAIDPKRISRRQVPIWTIGVFVTFCSACLLLSRLAAAKNTRIRLTTH